MKIVKPKRLIEGQTIGVIAPASPSRNSTDIDVSLLKLQELGFKIKVGKHLYDRHGFYAGLDEHRAADVNAMFADDAVDGIICLRSGQGSARLLPFLDYDMIRQHPKVIIGFSDLTALLNVIHVKTGMITFHGPEAEDQIISKPYSLTEFKKVVMSDQPNVGIGVPIPQANKNNNQQLRKLVSGKASGRLIGGNLEMLSTLIGTPFEPEFRGKLLVLEDVGGNTYDADRYLNHLWLAGKLQEVAGVIFGVFSNYKEPGFTLYEVLTERFMNLKIPAIYGLMIGHMDEQTTIPLGCLAELDADAGTLTLLESATY